jgi:hypothetical protein
VLKRGKGETMSLDEVVNLPVAVDPDKVKEFLRELYESERFVPYSATANVKQKFDAGDTIITVQTKGVSLAAVPIDRAQFQRRFIIYDRVERVGYVSEIDSMNVRLTRLAEFDPTRKPTQHGFQLHDGTYGTDWRVPAEAVTADFHMDYHVSYKGDERTDVRTLTMRGKDAARDPLFSQAYTFISIKAREEVTEKVEVGR